MGVDQLETSLARLNQLLGDIAVSASMKPAVDRWRSDAAALLFHLRPRDKTKPLLVAVIGGTGTGKSTMVNRLLGASASATSFRRTFTSGAVAIARAAEDVPRGWLGVEHHAISSAQLPARGQGGALLVVPRSILGGVVLRDELLARVTLIDTPDLDGDQPAHHAEADRVFRWAQALVFLVTPEKYQMTELLPYYRLAARYAVPTLFVMNKCEEQAVAEDYREQLGAAGWRKTAEPARAGGERTDAPADDRPVVYTIARDDAAYEPPPAENLDALRGGIAWLGTSWPVGPNVAVSANNVNSAPASSGSGTFLANSGSSGARNAGLANRAADLVGRIEDQVLAPMRQERQEADRLIEALHAMEAPQPGVDVNPVTQDLQRRLQQRSVLYLIGPQRVLDRVRQAPALLVRLPRVAWDFVMRGDVSAAALNPAAPEQSRQVPDFRALLIDQFAVLQSRIDDLLRQSPVAAKWIDADGGHAESRLAGDEAGRIADEEIAQLKAWLEKRWNATPRDTRAVQALLKYLPGGKKLAGASEAAPYLLAIGLIASHAVFGTDLLVLGGYTLATWLSERLSNEVAGHTRATNARITDRFSRLAHEQIARTCAWLDRQAAAPRKLEELERAATDLARAAGMEGT